MKLGGQSLSQVVIMIFTGQNYSLEEEWKSTSCQFSREYLHLHNGWQLKPISGLSGWFLEYSGLAQ